MQRFDSDGVEIAFLREGEGDPILLVHGFVSTARISWVGTGWVEALTRAGHRVIALDQRGHGASRTFYDPACYREAPSLDAVQDEEGQVFRRFAEYTGGDRHARGLYPRQTRTDRRRAARHPHLPCPLRNRDARHGRRAYRRDRPIHARRGTIRHTRSRPHACRRR